MYNRLASSIFSIQNFFDEISIIDQDGIIRYCEIFTSNTYSFSADEIIGRHVFDVFPSSNEENSEIYRVLKTGRPIASFEENCVTYKGDVVKGYSSVYPLYRKNKQIGAAVALKFFGSDYRKEFIQLQDNAGIRSTGSEQNYTVDDMITADPYMIRLKEKIRKVSNTDSAVLIEGKTGTGKELAAQSLHFSSQRAALPFVSQNCSAIPGNLLESTLFGTEKGSYTGAVTNKGLFELANGGTLFLDEINSMEFSLQGKLLKAIEDKSVRRLGGRENIRVDVRIVAAVNEDPFVAMAAQRLRSDLFYRLNVISFRLSELKDRPGDITFLTKYYIDYYNRKTGKALEGLDRQAALLFQRHSWPGNVRELRNMIEGAFAVAEGRRITMEDLPDYLTDCSSGGRVCRDHNSGAASGLSGRSDPGNYQEQVEEFERDLLLRTIANSPTKSDAARRLGLTRQALNYKLDSLGIKQRR